MVSGQLCEGECQPSLCSSLIGCLTQLSRLTLLLYSFLSLSFHFFFSFSLSVSSSPSFASLLLFFLNLCLSNLLTSLLSLVYFGSFSAAHLFLSHFLCLIFIFLYLAWIVLKSFPPNLYIAVIFSPFFFFSSTYFIFYIPLLILSSSRSFLSLPLHFCLFSSLSPYINYSSFLFLCFSPWKKYEYHYGLVQSSAVNVRVCTPCSQGAEAY